MNNLLNISKRRSLIVKDLPSLRTAFRITEVQIIVGLLLIGFVLVFGKGVLFEYRTVQMDKAGSQVFEGDSYSFDRVVFGFQRDVPAFDFEKDYNLEKNLLLTLPLNIRRKASNSIKAILKISEIHQVDPIWITSVIWTESHFNPKAKSSVGARGLMQVMPTTKKYILKKLRRARRKLIIEMPGFDAQDFSVKNLRKDEKREFIKKLVNIELGVIYLKRLLKRFDNSHKLATIAYNMGPSWTKRRLVLNLPVGNNNHYFNKVNSAYRFITKRI